MSPPRFGASSFIWVSPFSNDTLHLIDKVAEAGFDLLEIAIEDPATVDTAAIGSALKRAGIGALVCGAFGPDRDVSSDDPAVQESGVAYLKTCVDLARELGSPLVSGPMYSATGKVASATPEKRSQQWDRIVQHLGFVADYAAAPGVSLAIEPLNRFETDLVNTVEQGCALIDRLGRSNVGLLLDTFHMNIEEESIPDALRCAGARLFNFHACSNTRGVPGRDHLPWPEITRALSDIGYNGPWVIEAFNPDITEIAKAVSLWRELAPSQDHVAFDGLHFLKETASS